MKTNAACGACPTNCTLLRPRYHRAERLSSLKARSQGTNDVSQRNVAKRALLLGLGSLYLPVMAASGAINKQHPTLWVGTQEPIPGHTDSGIPSKPRQDNTDGDKQCFWPFLCGRGGGRGGSGVVADL